MTHYQWVSWLWMKKKTVEPFTYAALSNPKTPFRNVALLLGLGNHDAAR